MREMTEAEIEECAREIPTHLDPEARRFAPWSRWARVAAVRILAGECTQPHTGLTYDDDDVRAVLARAAEIRRGSK